jgi:hypothetical protein
MAKKVFTLKKKHLEKMFCHFFYVDEINLRIYEGFSSKNYYFKMNNFFTTKKDAISYFEKNHKNKFKEEYFVPLRKIEFKGEYLNIGSKVYILDFNKIPSMTESYVCDVKYSYGNSLIYVLNYGEQYLEFQSIDLQQLEYCSLINNVFLYLDKEQAKECFLKEVDYHKKILESNSKKWLKS